MATLITGWMVLATIAAAPAGTSSVSAAPKADDKPFTLGVLAEFRTLAVSDEDPANDRGLFYRGELGWVVTERVSGFIRAGVAHRFVEAGTAPAVRFQDLQVGGVYRDELRLSTDQKVDLRAQLGLFLPTSRASQRQTLYAAPELSVGATWSPMDWLGFDLGVLGQYRFVQFAERDGPGAPMNTQLVLGASLGAFVTPYQTENLRWVLGGSLSTTTRKRYASVDTFESPSSDETFWDQLYGWSLYTSFTPVAWLTASLALEQGGPVLRDGVVNVFFTKLEETELVLGLALRY